MSPYNVLAANHKFLCIYSLIVEVGCQRFAHTLWTHFLGYRLIFLSIVPDSQDVTISWQPKVGPGLEKENGYAFPFSLFSFSSLTLLA